MKKVFILSSIFLSVVLLLWGVYNLAFKKNEKSDNPGQTGKQNFAQQKTEASLNNKNNQKLTAVSKNAVVGAVADKKSEKILYYSALDGTVWQVDSDGLNSKQISDVKLSGLVSASWSPDKSKVLTVLNKGGKNTFFYYDNVKKSGVQLKNGLDNVVWDSLGEKIVYKYYDEKSKKRSLNIANPDGSNWQELVQNVSFRSVSIAAVPSTSVVSFWNSPSANEESKLQVFSIAGGEVRNILSGKFGGDYLWSPDGSQALVSSLINKENKSMTLGLVDLQGNYRDLNIPTITSKCAWSVDGKTVYYALPGGIPTGSIMPDDYQNKKFTTNDTFWKINITTGSKQRILELSDIKEAYDIFSPFLSSTEDSLFFTNRVDGKLYRISL